MRTPGPHDTAEFSSVRNGNNETHSRQAESITAFGGHGAESGVLTDEIRSLSQAVRRWHGG